MKLICTLAGHRAGPETWNDGLYFARCTRCGGDLIRQRGAEWAALPPGLRVTWHPNGHKGLHWSKAISRARDRTPRTVPKPAPRRHGEES